jgi:hypothetical protein
MVSYRLARRAGPVSQRVEERSVTSIQVQRTVRQTAAILLLATTAWAQESEEPATFRFAPVDGEVWVKEIDATQVRDMGSVAPRQETRTKTSIELRYEQVPDGWVVHQMPLEAEMELNGQPMPNPGLQQTVGHEIRVQLDEEGNPVEVEGFQELMRRFEANVDPQTYAKMRQQMNAESMAVGEMRQWSELLQDIRGETVQPGETWNVLDQTTIMGGGVVGLAGYLKFDGWTELNGIRGFKTTYRYDSNGELMESVEGQATRTVSRRASDEPMARSNIELQGSLIRVIVPETGQLLYEVKEEWYEVPLKAMDGPKMRVESHHTYRFEKSS